MKKSTLLIITLFAISKIVFCQDWKYLKNHTYTYNEINDEYKNIQQKFPDLVKVNVLPSGQNISKSNQNSRPGKGNILRNEMRLSTSDIGLPIYHVVLEKKNQKPKVTLMLNNAIHPGEPCGVDASLKLANDLLSNSNLSTLLDNVRIVIIPIYNIGGALNRGQSRVNQPGPEEYGFRGNAKNLDLNRDFIKNDSKNAKTFARIYHKYNPHVFIDAHTTNGYDYQYGMGLLATHPDKLNPKLSSYMTEKMIPFFFEDMKAKNKEITPYVYGKGKIPEDGLKDYLETPRYSTGYTALFNTIGFITEAHKYKEYKERVEYTYEFYLSTLKWMSEHAQEMIDLKKSADNGIKKDLKFPIQWAEDTLSNVKRSFKGYEVSINTSTLTGQELLSYDRNKPFTKDISYYNHFKVSEFIQKPDYYVIPQAWVDVIQRLKLNRVKMTPLKNDSIIKVEMYYIDNFETTKSPYEGHYLHYNTTIRTQNQFVKYRKGDLLIKTNQKVNRYIVETLEPHAVDSYFNWNFFDAILQQKEWFSTFAFEETAKQVLQENPSLKHKFEDKRKNDVEFAASHFDQLYFIYKNSKYFEKTYMRYPVGRIIVND